MIIGWIYSLKLTRINLKKYCSGFFKNNIISKLKKKLKLNFDWAAKLFIYD